MPESIGRRIETLFEAKAPPVTLDELHIVGTSTPKRRGWVIGLTAAALAIVIVGGTALLMGDRSPPPPVTEPGSSAVFIPPTRVADGQTILDLTLLDGSGITLAYPLDLDLTSMGVEVQTVGSLEGAHSRVFGTHYGTPQSFIAMTEVNAGPGELVASYQGADGGVVELWEFPEEPIAYLVYDFESWTVYVWDGMGGTNLPMGAEAVNAWSSSLHASTDANGFLVLTADPPLELVNADDDPGPDGPDIRVDGVSGSLLVFINDCDRMTRLDEEAYGSEVFAFCDEPTNTLFFVGGTAEVQQRIHENLRVNPPPIESTTTTETTSPSTSSTTEQVWEAPPGWTIREIPFTVREGSAYATGGDWFFAWGGAPDRTGDLKRDGVLIDEDSGEWTEIPDAPISPRFASSVVWTGSEFIVFGGHSFDESFVNGAAFDPTTLQWRLISEAPLSPAANPAAVWDQNRMIVWLAGGDSAFAERPVPSVSQLASYDPSTDDWDRIDAPTLQIADADLMIDNGALLLVGGPGMRDATGSLTRSLYGTRLSPSTAEWSEPVLGPGVDAARLLRLPDGRPGVLVAGGVLYALESEIWQELPIDPALNTDRAEGCWWDLGAATGGGESYLKQCGSDLRFIDGTTLQVIIEPDDYGSTSNLLASAFVADEEGRLLVFGDSDKPSSLPTALFGIYTP